MKQDHGNQKQMVRNGKDKTTSMMDSPEKKKRNGVSVAETAVY